MGCYTREGGVWEVEQKEQREMDGALSIAWPHSCNHSQKGHSEGPGRVAGSAQVGLPLTLPAVIGFTLPTTALPEWTHRLPGPGASPTPQVIWPPHEDSPYPQDSYLPWGPLGRWGQERAEKETMRLPSWDQEEGTTCHTVHSAVSSLRSHRSPDRPPSPVQSCEAQGQIRPHSVWSCL